MLWNQQIFYLNQSLSIFTLFYLLAFDAATASSGAPLDHMNKGRAKPAQGRRAPTRAGKLAHMSTTANESLFDMSGSVEASSGSIGKRKSSDSKKSFSLKSSGSTSKASAKEYVYFLFTHHSAN